MRLYTLSSKVILPTLPLLIAIFGIWGMRYRIPRLPGKDDPPRSRGMISRQAEGAQRVVENSTFNSDRGRLYIYVMGDPNPVGFPRTLTNTDHFNSFLTGVEWEALFCDVLEACPWVSDRSLIAVDSEEQRRTKFVKAVSDYPLLARVSDMYIYVTYKPEEIQQLRIECLNIEHNTANKNALLWLTKLREACEDALKINSGLLLVPD